MRTLIKFLPTILNHLLNILLITSQQSIPINNQSNDISLNIIRVLINLIHMLYDAGRSDIVQSYIKYVFIINTTNNSNHVKQQIHFELIKHLPTILHPNNTDFLTINKFMKHSSFFFDIIIKSMAQYLLTTGRIKVSLIFFYTLRSNNEILLIKRTITAHRILQVKYRSIFSSILICFKLLLFIPC